MNWENILKVQVLGSKQKVKMGIKPLPKVEDENCKERFEKFVRKLSNLKSFASPRTLDHQDSGLLNLQNKLNGREDSVYCSLLAEINEYGNLLNQRWPTWDVVDLLTQEGDGGSSFIMTTKAFDEQRSEHFFSISSKIIPNKLESKGKGELQLTIVAWDGDNWFTIWQSAVGYKNIPFFQLVHIFKGA